MTRRCRDCPSHLPACPCPGVRPLSRCRDCPPHLPACPCCHGVGLSAENGGRNLPLDVPLEIAPPTAPTKADGEMPSPPATEVENLPLLLPPPPPPPPALRLMAPACRSSLMYRPSTRVFSRVAVRACTRGGGRVDPGLHAPIIRTLTPSPHLGLGIRHDHERYSLGPAQCIHGNADLGSGRGQSENRGLEHATDCEWCKSIGAWARVGGVLGSRALSYISFVPNGIPASPIPHFPIPASPIPHFPTPASPCHTSRRPPPGRPARRARARRSLGP